MALKSIHRCVSLCTMALLVMPGTASEHHGQVTFGGLPVPGAVVTASHEDKKFSAVTDQQGAYSFPNLDDGAWTVQVEMLGFSTSTRDLAIAPGAPAAEWDLKLLPFADIKAAAAAAPQEPAPTALQVRPAPRTPAPGNPPTQTTQTPFQRANVNASPSAASNAAASNEPPAPANDASQSNSDLSQRASDGFLVNGTANNGASSPFALPPAFGNNRRGGRPLYNGSIGLILDNSTLDARAFSLTGQDTPKPDYNHVQGVATFGGVVKIPHLIRNGPNFFIGYQWTRNRNATTQSALVPTLAERGGDFSQAVNPLGVPLQIFNPATGLPFSGNLIPISSQASALLNLYPLPNLIGAGRYNYQIPVVGATHQDSMQSRLNKTLSRKNQVSGLFAFQSTRTDDPNLFGFLDTGNTLGINTNVNWRHTFNPRLYGNIGFQFSRYSLKTAPYFANRVNVAGEAGITGDNQAPTNWGPPSLLFSSGIAGLSDAQAASNHNQTSGLSYEMFWGRRLHNITFGGDFRRQQFNFLSQQDPRGTFAFTGAATQAIVNGVPVAGTGSDFADFLLGVPDTSSIAFGNADKYFRTSAYDAYVTDDWRMNSSLTLNAGIRWEYAAPMTELYGRLVNLDIAPGISAVAPVVGNHPTGTLTGQTYPDSLIRPDKHAFQPRVGFSWRPFSASSMVVRGGYGVYYNTSVYQTIATQMAQQSPLSKNLNVQNSPANPLTLANGFNVPATTPNTFAIDPNFRIGYSQNWQLSVQRDLPGALQMTATYLGIKGTRGMQEFLPNTYPAGAANPCPTCPSGFVYVTSNGNSTRESAQIQLRRRLRNGLTATLQYTLSKSIDDDSSLGGGNQGNPPNSNAGAAILSTTSAAPGSQGSLIAQNWLNLSGERGLSNFDQRHAISVQAQYTTGMGVGGGTLLEGWKGTLLKEWTVATQITAGSGLPLTPIYLAAVNGTGVTGTIRPNYTGASLYAGPPGFFLNPAAFTAPTPGQWGNAGRNSITGPSQFSLNASMGRTFRMGDRLNLDLRIDSVNALNHVTYSSWNTTITNAQFGLPVSANPMRNAQVTLRLRF